MKLKQLAIVALVTSLFAPLASAQDAPATGQVKKIDAAGKKITVASGPIKSLDMDEPMTMVFGVKDPAMLKQVKVGDKISFEAEEATTGYTITKMQKTK